MPSRRKLIDMTEQEVRDYVDAQRTLVIVSNGKDGFPDRKSVV